MIEFLKRGASLTLAAFLCACAEPPHRPLPPAFAGLPHRAEVYLVMAQDDLEPEAALPAARTGLLGRFWPSDPPAALASMRATGVAKSFDGRLRVALATALRADGWSGAEVGVLATRRDADLDEVLLRSAAPAVLFVTVRHTVREDLGSLRQSALISLFRPVDVRLPSKKWHEPRSALHNAAYHEAIEIEMPLADAGDVSANSRAWTSEGGALLQRAFDQGAGLLADLVLYDLSRASGNPSESAREPWWHWLAPGVGDRIVEARSEGVLRRLRDGRLRFDAVPLSAPLATGP